MAVNLDLDDPVQTVADLLTNNISKTAHTVIAGYERGGYNWGDNKPRIIPIEGEVRDGKWFPRQGNEKIANIPGQHEIYVLKVDKNIDRASQTADHKYADKICRIQIDIYHGTSRAKLYELFREIEAVIYIKKTEPGGNWTEIDPLVDRELTNRRAGFWRITYDVELKKISDFIGST